MKNKVVRVISLIFTSLMTVFIIVFGLIYFVLLNPQKNFYKLFNTVFDTTDKIISKGSVQGASTAINKGNIKIDTNLEKYDGLNDYEIEYDIESDRNKNTNYIDLKFGDEEENIESTFYYEDNNLFVEFPYILSDIIKIPLNDYGYETNEESSINYNKESAKYLLKIIRDTFINNMNEEKLGNRVEDLHIKSTYNIDKKEFDNIIDKIIANLLKDEKAKSILKDEFKIDVYKLNKIKTKLTNSFDSNCEFIEINLYVSFLLQLDKVTINTKTNHLELLLDDTNIIKVEKNDKQIISAEFNDKMIKTTLNRKDNVFVIDLKIDTSRDELNLDGTVNYKEKDNYIKLDVSLSTLLNEKTNTYDTSPAKSFNQFTSKDLKAIDKIIGIANKYIELLTGNSDKKINLKK